MIEYLLDTNVVSEVRKHRPHGAVVAWFQSVARETVFVSVITINQLQSGIELTRQQDSVRAAELEHWLDEFSGSAQVLPVDVACAREGARLMDGKSWDLYEDAMIAATARVHSLTVVTRNERDFRLFNVPVLNPFTSK
ncbi:MAG TPA: type II toxin-antitoxin system VapC family toxin [Candidatus Koribacter sp.]